MLLILQRVLVLLVCTVGWRVRPGVDVTTEIKASALSGMSVLGNCYKTITVEPPNSGHVGTRHFIHYREVVLSSEVKKV